jgi:tight adherence protein B
MLILLFVLVLVTTFVVVMFVTKPTRQETEIENRLAELKDGRTPTAAPSPDSDILKRESYSDIPIVNAILTRLKFTSRIDLLIKQADSRLTVGRFLFGSLLVAVVAGTLTMAWLHTLMISIAVGVVAAAGPRVYLGMKRKSRLNRFEAVLPEAIDLLARALRAGHAVTAAIEMVAKEISDPVGPEFRRAFEEQNFGLPLREALLNLAGRVPLADLRFLVTAILVQKEAGGNLAEVLDKTGAVIRERSRLLGQLRIYTAQGRMTGWILGLLPFFIFGLLNIVNPGYAKLLLDDPTGREAIWIGLGLMSVGIWMIRKIVDIKV